MARKSAGTGGWGIGVGLQILILVILFFLIAFSALFWFDVMDIINSRVLISTLFSFFGVKLETEQQESAATPDVLNSIRLEQEREALKFQEDSLLQSFSELEEREQQLNVQEEAIRARETALADTEKTLNEKISRYDNINDALEKNAQDLMNMPPAEAVDILGNYEDQLLIDVLDAADALAARQGENSIVSYWLSLLPADRAAEIQKKITLRSEIHGN